MGKVSDGVRRAAAKMGSALRWPKRTPPPEPKQLNRWEGEGGSVVDDDDETNG